MSLANRILLALALCVLATVGACQFLLPERFAVNAPLLNNLIGTGRGAPGDWEYRPRMRGPEGYGLSIFARVNRVRMIEFSENGHLLASVPREDTVWRIAPDTDGDGHSDGKEAIEGPFDRPHGLDVHDGWLYVGEATRISRVRFDESLGTKIGSPVGLIDVPEGGNHWSRTVRVGPDGKLYVTVGSSCNVCIEEDERRAAMLRSETDGSGLEIYASGLRNSVDFDWHPESGALYATDNGRDLLGNDFPPCELNRIERGGFYGWPYANGAKIPDPDFGEGQTARIQSSIAPAFEFAAHNAPLGISFARGPLAPAEYRGAALVALHGSWNRTRKDGYKVVSLHWGPNGEIEQRDFLTGFEVDEDVIGRPVDVALGPDGAFYVSDDYAGVIWRLAPGEENRNGSGNRSGGSAPPDPLAALDPTDRSARDDRGSRLFAQHECASCHEAAQAKAGVVVTPIVSLAPRYSITQLANFFTAPTPPMPAFPLSERERTDLAVYLLGRFQ